MVMADRSKNVISNLLPFLRGKKNSCQLEELPVHSLIERAIGWILTELPLSCKE